MEKRLVKTAGIVVCEEKEVKSLWDIRQAESEGRGVTVDAGEFWIIVPAFPNYQKFIRCMHCQHCELVIMQHGPYFLTPDVWGKEKEVFTFHGELLW